MRSGIGASDIVQENRAVDVMGEGKNAKPELANDGLADLIIRFTLGALIVYWSFLLLSPFIAILVWAAILSVTLHPFYLRLQHLFRGRSTVAAFLVTAFALLAILVPVSAISLALVNNLTGLAAGIVAGTIKLPPPPPFVADIPLIGTELSAFWQSASVELVKFLESLAPQLTVAARKLLAVIGNVGIGVLQFTFAIVIAGFTFSRMTGIRKALTKFAARAAPDMGEGFLKLAAGTVRSVARGVIGISLVQAILFGVGALVAGIPLAGLWSFVVLVFAIIQIGPGLVITPMIIYAWSAMTTKSAILFTVYMVPVMFLDNALKPFVMGRGLPVPMLVILVGVVGGTIAHGLIGLFLGPIVLALSYELARAWINMPLEADDTRPPDPPGADLSG
ncbi:MAG: AI-2E family transporter [Geminicoccaceae bacterium]